MPKCALPFCQEQSAGTSESYGDLCSQHAIEARDFYSQLALEEGVGLMGPADPGSDSTNTLHGPDITKDLSAAKEVKVEVKHEFGERATLSNIKNLETLKLSAAAVKDALLDSFLTWCKMGVPVSKTDPIMLTVQITNFRGDVLKQAFKSTDLNVQLELSMSQRLGNLLYDLPLLFEEVASALNSDGQGRVRARRHCKITLSWWGTIKQTTMDQLVGKNVTAHVLDKPKDRFTIN